MQFGKYGNREAGDAKYASLVPHHTPHPTAEDIYDGPYVDTFDGATESLLCRIFDERDAMAEATVALVWRGDADGNGQTFLMRTRGHAVEEIPIPEECVHRFVADVTEEIGDEIKQVCFEAIVRG